MPASVPVGLSLLPLGIIGSQVASPVARAKALVANSESFELFSLLALGLKGHRVPRSFANCAKAALARSETLKLTRRLYGRRRLRSEAGKGGRPADAETGVPLTLQAHLLPGLGVQVIDELGATHDSFDPYSGVPAQIDKPADLVNHGLIDHCREVVEPGLGKPPA